VSITVMEQISRPPPEACRTREPARVVLAEDDPEMRRLVADCLRRAGYDVTEVSNGGALLRRLEASLLHGEETQTVDLIVTDARMPLCSGLEVVGALRDAGVHVPVIVMTAFGSLETHKSAQALGAAMLEKTFQLEQLLTVVGQLLGTRARGI
jgi:two-component system response regulator (stage 0 sporulation protein F)